MAEADTGKAEQNQDFKHGAPPFIQLLPSITQGCDRISHIVPRNILFHGQVTFGFLPVGVLYVAASWLNID